MREFDQYLFHRFVTLTTSPYCCLSKNVHANRKNNENYQVLENSINLLDFYF